MSGLSQKWKSQEDAEFFDRIADGEPIWLAAAWVGKNAEQGRDRMAYIRRRYGEQGK